MCWFWITRYQLELTLLAVFRVVASSWASTWIASSSGSREMKSTLAMSVSSRPNLTSTSTSESTSSPGIYTPISELVRAIPIPLS